MPEPLRLSVQEPPRKRRKGLVTFNIPEVLRRADEIMAGPCRGYMPRALGLGTRLQRFVLPLALAQTTNARFHQKAWALAAQKQRVFDFMYLQHPFIRAAPLPGRPQVLCVRFSVKEPDALNDGAKMAIDCLTVPRPAKRAGGRKKLGLGFIVDDAPAYVRIEAPWWEYAPPRFGFQLIDIWSG
jgi:hypothetical protein